MARRYVAWVIRYRAAVLIACLAVTTASGFALRDGVLASSMLKLFFGENPQYDRYVQLAQQFGDSSLMVVAFPFPGALSAEGAGRLTQMVEGIEQVPTVKRVESICSANRIRGTDDSLMVEPYGDLLHRAEHLDAVRRSILADDLLRDTLISADGRVIAILIELHADNEERPIEEFPALLEEIVSPVVTQGVQRDRVHLAGIVAESTEVTKQTRFNLSRIFPLSVLLLAGIVFLLFFRLWPVVITMGVSIVSVMWVFSLAVLWDPEINVMLAMVPAVIMVIAFSDIIHLCSAYLLELNRGHRKTRALLISAGEVGPACFFTSLTTLIGFGSLAFVPTPLFRQLGLVLGLGVAVALILALTLTPLALSFLPEPRPGTAPRILIVDRAIDRLASCCRHIASRHPITVVVVFGALTALSIGGVSQIRVETNLTKRLAPDNPLQKDQVFIRQHFAGTNFLDIFVSVAGDGDLLTGDRLTRIAAYQEALEQLPEVGRAFSLVDLVEILHRELTGDTGRERLPNSRSLLAQYLLLFEMSGGEGLERLVNSDRRVMRISLRLPSTALVETGYVGDRATALAEQMLGEDLEVEATGISYLFGKWIAFVVEGQKRGLAFALLTIALMMMVAVQRISAGLVAMVPNVIPLLFLGGYLGWAWDTVDSDTLMVAMIAIGISVDDTIHFLTRFRLEVSRSRSIARAMERTFSCTGRAIIQTTTILCAGFLPFALSDYFTTRIMGTLMPGCLLAALLADLLLLPALVHLRLLRPGPTHSP